MEKRDNILLLDENVLKSMQEMRQMLETLTRQYTLLKEEIQEIKKSQKPRNKKDIISFLNSMLQQHSIVFFEDWLNSISINNVYLQKVFSSDLTEGIKNCLLDLIINQPIDLLPLRSFKEKPGYLYIHSKKTKLWEILTMESFQSCIDLIIQQFVKAYIIYQNENILEDDLGLIYFIKISGTKIKKEKQLLELKLFLISTITETLESCFTQLS